MDGTNDGNIRIGIIGGTGIGDALSEQTGQSREIDTPFGAPSSPIVLTQWHGVDIAILKRHGPGHTYNPSKVPYRANVYALKSLGVTHIVASGATGSLREHIRPGHLVLVDQLIDKTYKRSNTFYEHAAIHVEMAEPFCPVMRRWLREAAKRLDGVTVHTTGTYVVMEGPSFSTRAESNMHRAWGGDLIGMTCMPEAKLAREAEIAYATVALPTDYDCWRTRHQDDPDDADASDLLNEILGNLEKATANSIELIRAALSDVSILRAESSPAHAALELAIWSDKSKIDPAQVDRLKMLWGRYFE